MRKMILQCGALALSLLAANVMAAVSPEEANKLGTHSRRWAPRRPATPTARFRRGPVASRKTPALSTAKASWLTRSPVKTAVHHHRRDC